jgi:hypothetical protein
VQLCFFLKEHVVSVFIKLRDDGGDFVYDLIKTLPVSKDKGMRTMCHDIDALAAALKTYAFGRFQARDVVELCKPFDERERERESQSLTRPCTRCVCKRCIEKHCMLFMLILFFCWIVSGLCEFEGSLGGSSGLDIFDKGSKETTTEWIATPKKHSTKQGALVSPDETANSIGTSNCFSVLDNDDVPELLDRDCSIALPQRYRRGCQDNNDAPKVGKRQPLQNISNQDRDCSKCKQQICKKCKKCTYHCSC